ncbi:MAG: carboxypeptidase-like regulatory domain-containing protein [Desulfobulbaceae bacterium]|nr:carboxypeptidase-like regulatory domain-containing protein [Desulfobulbaceae bacterium]
MLHPFYLKSENLLSRIITVVFSIGFLLLLAGNGRAEERSVFSGHIVDVAGDPVPGAEVFIYSSDNVRQAPDYIAPPTDERGEFRVILPPGRYWTVARLRQDREKFGPLLPTDKHSGPPLEVDILSGEQTEEVFTVADLQETSRLAVKFDTSFARVEGIIRNSEGQPVANGYVYANREKNFKKIPDFVSAWTDGSGRYTLFLPPGTYYLGPAREFPPEPAKPEWIHQIIIDSDTAAVDIVLEK